MNNLSTINNLSFTIPSTSNIHNMTFYITMLDKERVGDDSIFSLKQHVSSNGEIYFNYLNTALNNINFQNIIQQDASNFNKLNNNDYSDINIDPAAKILRVYFPLESISTYYNNATKFFIDVYTYINNTKIHFYSGLMDSFNNLACAPFSIKGIHYQEYCDIYIEDPEFLLYSTTTDYNNWRKTYCNSSEEEILSKKENILNINIYSIEDYNDEYISKNNTFVGFTSLNFFEDSAMKLYISYDDENKYIHMQTACGNIESPNSLYNEWSNDFQKYIRDIYFDGAKAEDETEKFRTVWYISIVDMYNEILYRNIYHTIQTAGNHLDIPYSELGFNSRDDWSEGMRIVGFISVYNIIDPDVPASYEGNEDCIFTLKSIPLNIISDKVSYLIPITSNLTSDNLAEIKKLFADMTINNFDVVNKNITTVQQIISNVNNSQTLKPVFFRVVTLSDIILHRDVTENIQINLDSYKSKVTKFYLKLCGNYFEETARIQGGVIFNINGSIITTNTGIFYICDQDKNVITSGKYKCE